MKITNENWLSIVKKEFPKIYEHQDHDTIYLFLFDFLEAVVTAHVEKNINFLEKAYSFAEKCYLSKDKYIWNAISVAFYEHMTDDPATFYDCLNYIPEYIIKNCVLPLTKASRPTNFKKFQSAAKSKFPKMEVTE